MADKLYYDSATGTTFKEAFADARKEGKKVFEWNGKKYNTKLKGEDEPKQSKYKESSTIEAGRREKSAPKEEEKKEEKRSGTGAAAAAAGTALGAAALLKAMRKSGQDRGEGDLERAAREREGRAKSGTSLRMPGSRMDKNDPYSMTLGSDLDPKSMMRNRLSGDIDYKKGGKIRKFAAGGVTPPPASTPKSAPKRPLPPELQREKDNQDQDRRNRKEREAFDKYDKTRLRDQGGLKKGGVTRGDGIAMRGKTKGRMR